LIVTAEARRMLPMFTAVAPAPIFNIPVESSEELLTPTNVRVPVVLPITWTKNRYY